MHQIKFMVSLLLFYLKGTIEIHDSKLRIVVPNTFLTVIPLGSNKYNVPVGHITSIEDQFKVNAKSLIAGVILFIIGVTNFSSRAALALLLIIISAFIIITSFKTIVEVTIASGKVYSIPFLVIEKQKALDLVDKLNYIVDNRTNDTNVRIHQENSTDRIVNAINGDK